MKGLIWQWLANILYGTQSTETRENDMAATSEGRKDTPNIDNLSNHPLSLLLLLSLSASLYVCVSLLCLSLISLCLSLSVCVCLSLVRLAVYVIILAVFLSASLSTSLSLPLSPCLSHYLYPLTPLSPSLSLSLSLSLSFSLSLSLSLYLSIYLSLSHKVRLTMKLLDWFWLTPPPPPSARLKLVYANWDRYSDCPSPSIFPPFPSSMPYFYPWFVGNVYSVVLYCIVPLSTYKTLGAH